MSKPRLPRRVFEFYRDGFRSMDIGRVLWLVVAVKLFLIFVVIRLFLMPDTLRERAGRGNEAEYVSTRLTKALTDDNT